QTRLVVRMLFRSELQPAVGWSEVLKQRLLMEMGKVIEGTFFLLSRAAAAGGVLLSPVLLSRRWGGGAWTCRCGWVCAPSVPGRRAGPGSGFCAMRRPGVSFPRAASPNDEVSPGGVAGS